MSVQIKGVAGLVRKLRQLERVGAKRAMRKATRAGTTVLAKAVRAATPTDEGKLRRMMTSVVTSRGLSASGKVGADVAKLQAAAGSEGDAQRPSNIDHLVEFGHVTPGGSFVPPTGFMRRAAASAMPPAEAAYAAKLRAEIDREAGKS